MKKTRGITLIALVITIVIILILAGVALATLTGEGNIIQNAENAVAKYNNSVIKEQIALNNIEKYLGNGSIGSSTDTSISTSTGKCTLLWENPSSSEERKEETIEVENLNKYRYIFIELFADYGEGYEPLRRSFRRSNIYTNASNNRR